MSAQGNSGPFSARAIGIALAVVVVGFLSYLLLSAYAPDFRSTSDGGAHALSPSAVGFSGAAELIQATQGSVGLIRRDGALQDEGLLILTVAPSTRAAQVKAILDAREDLATLIVLPKWAVQRLPAHPAWVRALGILPGEYAMRPLEGIVEAGLSENGPGELRSIHGTTLKTIAATEDGRPLLVQIGEAPHFILSDPDVLNNQGLKTRSGAERAMALLNPIMVAGRTTSFDLTLMGFGADPNLLKLAFDPPFLPMTLCLLFAALLAGLHTLRRFGPPAHEQRKVAFGKRGIAENGAALLRLAKRRHMTGGRYAALIRDAVATASGAPAGLTGDALDTYLDRLSGEGEPFTSLAARAEDAPDTRRLLIAARALHQWRRTVTREH
jgi:hypothetical protein